jgi:eukaryotic-like serine/threonine-protein kinase
MGSIWRVLDRTDGAVKVAKILRQSDAASLLRFVREQSMRIDHTHVVTPLSWAGMDDRVLFTMPLVRGGSVSDLLRENGALPVRWVALLTDQLLQALEAVHGAGIVHRDVKPGNLLLEPTGIGFVPHLRLTDFGIAAPLDAPRMTRASVAIGTPGYMPPEQWHGADPDPRADLYAVGRVALEMLTGRRPASRPDAVDPVGDPAGHPSVPDGDPHRASLQRLIDHATAEAIDDRPADVGSMRSELAATGLLTLPRPADEALSVPDRFAALPTPRQPPAAPPPPPPPPLRVRADAVGAEPGSSTTLAAPSGAPGTLRLPPPPEPPSAGRRSPVLGLVLILAGLLGLVVSTYLVLSA